MKRKPAAYHAELAGQESGIVTVLLSFGRQAQNDEIVPDAIRAVAALRLAGGKGIKLNGPCTLPVAVAISHSVAHLFGFVAFFDPKLAGYVVCVSHDPAVAPGDLLE